MSYALHRANAQLDGQLKQSLEAMRFRGMTLRQISAAFADEGIDVSAETVRHWLVAFGMPTRLRAGLTALPPSGAAPGSAAGLQTVPSPSPEGGSTS